MKERHYNSLTHRVHTAWAAKVLNMRINHCPGPDLIDKNKIVEVKMHLGQNRPSWTILGHQINYAKEKRGYWALGVYSLNRERNQIETNHLDRFEEIVKFRQLYVVEWSWIDQFPKHRCKGKTEISEWDHELIYPKVQNIPKVTNCIEVDKGIIYFTSGTSSEIFGY